MNYKKQMGESLKEMKQQEWYKELPEDLQKEAADQVFAYHKPLNNMQNTLLNIAMDSKVMAQWVEECAKIYPWADPIKTLGDVSVHKAIWATGRIPL